MNTHMQCNFNLLPEAYNPEASNFPLCVKNHARVF